MSKPDSIYRFEKATTAKEKYLLTEKQGADTLLLGKCKIGVDMGKEYILFAPTRENKTGGRQWDYSLYSTSPVLCAVKGKETGKANVSKVRISGVNFPPQFCGKAYGDTLSPYLTGADALLIELAQDAQHLTIAVFKGMAAQVRPLFEKWVAGQLCMVAASEALFCCLFSRKTSLLKPSFHGLKNDSAIKSYFYPQNLGGGQEKVIDHITLHSVGGLQNIEKLEGFHRGDTATGKAHIANMGVSCSLGGVILRGSLAKFHNGENCTDFARKDIETALIKLSAILGLDLLQAVVYSVEIGYSVIVKNSPSEYLRLFSDISKQRKVHSKNGVIETVSYGTRKGSYQFCAYDKAREMQKEGMKAPLLYEGENVLRLEYRITKRRGIQAQFHRDLLAQDLFAKETYKALNTLFLRFYKSLPKMGRTVIIDRSKSVTPSRWEALTGEAYRQTNPNAYNATLQSLNEQNQVLPKNLERIRARDRKRNKDFTISDTNPLIAELDALLEMAVIIDV